MTGIERLRGVAGFWRENKLDDIADQIKRERACDADTIENIRLIVGGVVDEMEHHILGHEGMEDSPVARWARELREALVGDGRDPAADVSVSAYDLLPQEDREAVAWVREHGGLDEVRTELDNLRGAIKETCARLGVDHTGDLTADAQGIWRAIDRLKSLLGDSVPRAAYERRLARRQRQIDESHAALRRRNARIAELERAARIHRFHDAINSKSYVELLDKYEELLTLVDNQRASLDGLTAAIDEMRPRLMPDGMCWPVFEDGEPVHIGDEVDFGGEGGAASSVELQDDGHFVIHACDGAGDYSHRNFRPGERVKRPTPKVLDADGVEIRVGDTVWPKYPSADRNAQVKRVEVVGIQAKYGRVDVRTVYATGMSFLEQVDADRLTHRAPVLAADGRPLREGETVWLNERGFKSKIVDRGEPLKVVAFDKNGSVGVLDRDGIALGETSPWWFNPSCLTHERPVLDADGKPLREGETVWNVKTGERYVVGAFAGGCVNVSDGRGGGLQLLPSQLTHERPIADTWERLERDAKAAVCVYFGVSDRDCGSCGHSSWECSYDKARDLVRRAKKLAGVIE